MHNLCLSRMKYLSYKPVIELFCEDFLRLTMAEKDGLITIDIAKNLRGITGPSYIEEAKKLFCQVSRVSTCALWLCIA